MQLTAGLLSPESAQDGIIRGYLIERDDQIVKPYNYTVADFTTRISNLRNRLGRLKMKGFLSLQSLEPMDGLVAVSCLWALIPFPIQDIYLEEIRRITHGTGNVHVPGRFFPQGANGRIARRLFEEENLML